jgi:DNA polymerase-3 subunit epsilon
MTGNFVALDFETSDYPAHSACSIGLVRVEAGKIVSEFSCLIRPPQEYVRFTSIHGIRWEDVCDKPHFGEAWPTFSHFFENIDFIVAHNSSFDRGVLRACCALYNIAMPELPFKCTVQVARKHFGISPAKLSNVCSVLGIDLNHHEALSDARASATILLRQMKELEAKVMEESLKAPAPL